VHNHRPTAAADATLLLTLMEAPELLVL
jgi:hypothetical protein